MFVYCLCKVSGLFPGGTSSSLCHKRQSLKVLVPSVVMLSAVILSAVMLSVVIFSFVILSILLR